MPRPLPHQWKYNFSGDDLGWTKSYRKHFSWINSICPADYQTQLRIRLIKKSAVTAELLL